MLVVKPQCAVVVVAVAAVVAAVEGHLLLQTYCSSAVFAPRRAQLAGKPPANIAITHLNYRTHCGWS